MKRLAFLVYFFLILSFVQAQPCLPDGIIFTTQSQIDSFQIIYPNCTEIEGSVLISGDVITNLLGLSVLSSIGGNFQIGELYIGNPNLANLDVAGYKRIDVTDRIVEYDFTGGRVYAFKALPQNTYRPDLDRKGSILGKAYVEKIASACDSIGTDFRKEFEESTIPYNPEMVATVIWKIVE